MMKMMVIIKVMIITMNSNQNDYNNHDNYKI